MNPENKILPDDPRLTTFALGEMEPAERVEFEQLLQQDAEARATVDAIRSTALALGSALEGEPLPAGAPAAVTASAETRPPKQGGGKVLRFPQLYFIVSTAAAACFAVFFVYWSREQAFQEAQAKHYVLLQEATVDALRKVEAEKQAVAATQMARREDDERSAKMKMVIAPTAAAVSAPAPVVALQLPTVETAGVPKEEENKPVTYGFVGGAPASNVMASDAGAVAHRTPSGPIYMDGVKQKTASAGKKDGRIHGAVSFQPTAFAGKEAPVGDVRLQQNLKDRDFNTEAYSQLPENPFLAVAQNPLSTFSIDVDTAAYANLRRFLTAGQRPPRDAVRIEEMVNYFPYHYAPPTDQAPFAASMEVASAPWTPEHRLVRIGLKGREVSDAARPKANLVFLLDVSGSMNEPNKLPLVKQSLHLLVGKLRPEDRVAIVVYAGASGMALPSTSAREQTKILAAIDELQPEGSTNGAAGIQLAYDIAKANFVAGGVNRVILATDGDFNVGTTSEGELTSLIEEKAKSGVFLTVLGFGMGNYKDATLEKLADKGNGNYAYIDTAAEARKALVEQAGGTLVTIAKDVKIQVEFNPAQVQAYRLIGYENRMLRNEDFNNDKVDAGEIGAGHTVTALYELVPVGASVPETGSVDALKYQRVEARANSSYASAGELLTLKVRYKEPTGDVSKKLEFPLRDSDQSFEQASADFKFAASVAAFGMILRDSPHKGAATFADVTQWAQSGIEQDTGGYRSEFIGLVRMAEAVVR